MLMTLKGVAMPENDDARVDQYLADIEAIQHDLVAVVLTHAMRYGWPKVIHALVETAGDLAVQLVAQNDRAVPMLKDRIAELYAYVNAGGPPQ